MNKTVLSLDANGQYVLSRSVDNKLYSLKIPSNLTVEILYSYYCMNDEDFKRLCNFARQPNLDK
jgi:hypothetical protein